MCAPKDFCILINKIIIYIINKFGIRAFAHQHRQDFNSNLVLIAHINIIYSVNSNPLLL